MTKTVRTGARDRDVSRGGAVLGECEGQERQGDPVADVGSDGTVARGVRVALGEELARNLTYVLPP